MTYTLGQVSKVLGVSPRQIQYLCEAGVVEPSQPARGTGHPARFSLDNLADLELALQLDDMTKHGKKKVLRHYRSGDRFVYLSKRVVITLYESRDQVRSRVDRQIRESTITDDDDR